MKKEDFNKIQPEIQEYIQYMIDLKIINSENKEKILDKLSHTKIERVHNETFGGKTLRQGKDIIVQICENQIKLESEKSKQDYNEALYENIFHELTHASSILDDEIEEKITTIFSKLNTNNNDFPYINYQGYTIINEFIAQSIAQKMVTEKYKEKYNGENLYKKKHSTFTYNENRFAPNGSSFSYEYDSSLNYYGEIEEFALKFIESVYGKRDIERLYNDHFNGDFIEKTANEFSKRKNGLDNLYQLFGNMSNIITYDYYQQGYYPGHYPSLTVDKFKKSVTEFNKIIDFEIERQQSI